MTRLLAVVVLAACSSRAPAPTGPTPDRPPAGSGSAPVAAGSGSAVAPADARPTEAECDALLDKLIALDLEARPADQQLTADQQAEVRAAMRAEHHARCRELDRALVQCAIAAPTRDALVACDR